MELTELMCSFTRMCPRRDHISKRHVARLLLSHLREVPAGIESMRNIFEQAGFNRSKWASLDIDVQVFWSRLTGRSHQINPCYKTPWIPKSGVSLVINAMVCQCNSWDQQPGCCIEGWCWLSVLRHILYIILGVNRKLCVFSSFCVNAPLILYTSSLPRSLPRTGVLACAKIWITKFHLCSPHRRSLFPQYCLITLCSAFSSQNFMYFAL